MLLWGWMCRHALLFSSLSHFLSLSFPSFLLSFLFCLSLCCAFSCALLHSGCPSLCFPSLLPLSDACAVSTFFTAFDERSTPLTDLRPIGRMVSTHTSEAPCRLVVHPRLPVALLFTLRLSSSLGLVGHGPVHCFSGRALALTHSLGQGPSTHTLSRAGP